MAVMARGIRRRGLLSGLLLLPLLLPAPSLSARTATTPAATPAIVKAGACEFPPYVAAPGVDQRCFDSPQRKSLMVRPGAPLEVAWINNLLDRLEADGKLAALWRSRGIVE